VAHLRAVPDPDDDPQVEPGPGSVVEPVDPAAAVAPGEDDEPTTYDEGDHVAVEEEPRRYPSTIGGACYLAILATAGVALVIAARGDWRLGMQILGGSLLVAALLRLVLANRDAGMLAVRNRFLDAFLLIGCGAALITLAASIPDMPLT
jgi:hypothetical protein